jgi:hypothetical protein
MKKKYCMQVLGKSILTCARFIWNGGNAKHRFKKKDGE